MVKLHFTTDQEWYELRGSHIGDSEIASLFDVQPDYIPGSYALWHYKARFVAPPALNTNPIKWGSRFEKSIAEDNGWEIRKGGYFQDDSCPHLGASLDYEIISGHDQDGIGCLEIKNVNTFNFSKSWTDNDPPLHILLQLQHQLAATGYKWGVIAALRGGNEPYIFIYKENQKTIQNIRMKVKQFWKSLDDKTPPPPDSAGISNDILKQLYPTPVEDDIDLSNDNKLPMLCAEFLKLKETKKHLTQTHDQLKYKILEKLKGHKKAVANRFCINLSVTSEKPSRPALPGEIVNGRAETRSLRSKEVNN